MKKSSGRSSLSQGILSVTTKDAGRNISATHSPSVPVEMPRALRELSLSDTEGNQITDDTPSTPKKTIRCHSEVLVTETTNHDDSRQSGAVETVSFKTRSPARIICHSPSSFEGNVPDCLVDTDKSIPVSLDGGESKENATTFITSSDQSETRHTSKTSTEKKASDTSAMNTTKPDTRKKVTGATKKKKFTVPSRYKLPSNTKQDNSLEFSAIPADTTSVKSAKSKLNGRMAHSTPYLMNSVYEEFVEDGSILDTTEFQKRSTAAEIAARKGAMRKKKGTDIRKAKSNSSLTNHTSAAKKSKSKEDEDEVSQLTLDLHWCRNVQMKYLSMKAKQTFDKQEEKAKADLHGIWTANCKLQKEVHMLEQTVKTMEMELAVEQLLRTQVEGLGEIDDKITNVMLSTSMLSDALTYTAQYLPVKNVILDEEKLIPALQESERLLGEITAQIGGKKEGIDELASTAHQLEEKVKAELTEQTAIAEHLATCNSLVNHERSLQVDLWQSDEF